MQTSGKSRKINNRPIPRLRCRLCEYIAPEAMCKTASMEVYAHLFDDDCNVTIYEQRKDVHVCFFCWEAEGAFLSPRDRTPRVHSFRPPQLCTEGPNRIKCVWCNGSNIPIDDSVTGTARYWQTPTPNRAIVQECEICIMCLYDHFNETEYSQVEGAGA